MLRPPRERGFTLIEVLMSVVIIGMLVGMSLPIYQSFQTRNDLAIATEGVAGMLRRAQTYARGMSNTIQNDTALWGVHVEVGSATLFKGASYAARDTSLDEVMSIPATFSVAASDVRFSKMYGLPTATGTVATITTNNTNDSRTITINAKGMVSY